VPHHPPRRGGRTRRLTTPLLVATALLAAPTGVAAASEEHVVRPGETVSGIAAARGVTVPGLVAENGLADPDHVRAGQRLSVPAPGGSGSSVAPGPAPAATGDVGALIDRVASERGWSSAFVKAIAWQESGWQQDRVSSAGAVGIMQVMPATGQFVSDRLVGRQLDLHDPVDNVTAGVVYLQHLWEVTGGDVERTLAGYYQGLGSLERVGLYDDTESYIANVLALRERYR
jgi:N-acetylmuramoyl-L-alanine amidase